MSVKRINFDNVEYAKFFVTSFEHIYKPDDDSRFLLDAVDTCWKLITETIKPKVCLEIGSGSGFVINSLSNTFGDQMQF